MKTYVEDLIYGRRRSLLVGPILSALSLLYCFALFARRAWYRLPWPGKKTLPCTVISVGNITLGGTGKTPAVIEVAGLILRNGHRPAVISRGYGRQDESHIAIVSDGRTVQHDPLRNGDEPVLIAERLTGVPVVVGADRYQASLAALGQFHPEVIVLDDGFQHIRLRRSIDIVLVDAAEPFGSGRLFPAGILREPLTALKRAHAILITRADRGGDLSTLKETLSRYTAARIFTSSHVPLDLVNIATNETRPLSSLQRIAVCAFSGIARPASFLSLLQSLGAVVKCSRTYPDHHVYDKNDLANIFQQAADEQVNMIITTEKDAVRFHSLRPEGIWALRISLQVVESGEWERFLLEVL
ncbi:MAG: tetraacyldisaccharide 4'-kinase [Nitrospirae bacterium GWC2_56_14]|nr:MAG: tetraacyldisaccharide 4'-kinase [Nitrospirae bacterium GWC2_56_14]